MHANSGGSYEYTRDNFKVPTCWMVENDGCLPHFHSSVELTYVLDGEIKAISNGRTYFLRRGQLLLSPSYYVHNYMTESTSKSIVLVIPLDFVPMYSKSIENKTFAEFVCTDENPEKSEILHCLERLLEMDKMQNMTVKGYIYTILGILTEKLGLSEKEPNRQSDLAKEILVYLQENFLSPLSLESVAEHFGYSKSRFSHIFNSFFGCGINQYISSLRCRKAASLLAEESMPLIDAALNSGFDSMRTFYRSFKAQFGITPSEYCKNYAKKYNNPELFFPVAETEDKNPACIK